MKLRKILAGLFAGIFVMGAGMMSACSPTEDLTVYMPDGAPALAFAKLLYEDTEEDGITYKVVAPNLIKTKVTYNDDSKNADLCVLPLTAATKLLGMGEKYQMLGTVTHGNLYLISKDTDTRYALNNISALQGKTVGVLQLNEVPGLIFKTVLSKAGVAYQENGEPSADKVNLIPITGAQDVGAMDGVDLFLLAEPAATIQMDKDFEIVGDVQAMYGGENGYPQAVLVAKRAVIEKQWKKVSSILSGLEESDEWILDNEPTNLVFHLDGGLKAIFSHLEDETYSSSWLVFMSATYHKWGIYKMDIIARCSAWYQSSADSVTDVKAFLTAAQAVNANMATMPSDNFFYGI